MVRLFPEQVAVFTGICNHVHDACKEEINRCNIFVLVIGNNYGSMYHKHSSNKDIPESVTLQEFKKALEVGIPKYIFINKFVQHDFENYNRSLTKHVSKYFSENEVKNDQIEQTRDKIKKQYDLSYPFPQEAYQYVFYFLDIVYSLDINNARYPFESFEDIKEILRKQWAGYVYDSLTKESTVSIEKVELLGKKLEKIEHQLKLIAESTKVTGDKNKITIDLRKLSTGMDIENLVEMQDKIDLLLKSVLENERFLPRLQFKRKVNEKESDMFLDTLNEVVKNFKWSKFVPITELFNASKYAYWTDRADVPDKTLLEISIITNNLSEDDRKLLLKTISMKFNEQFEPDKELIPEDDVPF